MARPKNTIRTIFKNIALPEDLVAKVELELYSEVEGKIPFGAQSEFFTKLLQNYFAQGTAHLTVESRKEPRA